MEMASRPCDDPAEGEQRERCGTGLGEKEDGEEGSCGEGRRKDIVEAKTNKPWFREQK
jgi:hypothetical protein